MNQGSRPENSRTAPGRLYVAMPNEIVFDADARAATIFHVSACRTASAVRDAGFRNCAVFQLFPKFIEFLVPGPVPHPI